MDKSALKWAKAASYSDYKSFWPVLAIDTLRFGVSGVKNVQRSETPKGFN
jgi:hypothetical protein